MTTNLSGSVALVTGASSGIGLATARRLRARGARVALAARGRDALDAAVRELGEAHAAAFPVDVTDRTAVLALPRRVVERFGRLDVVVNNAGANYRGPFRDRTPRELEAILDTNLVAPVLLALAALPLLGRGGVLVQVASLAGKVPVPDEAAYCASKAGLRAFSRALDLELDLEGAGVRLATVCPGPVDTGFLGEDLSLVPDIVLSQPMRTADDVAVAVLAAIDGPRREIDLPAVSGKLATLGYLSPRIFRLLRPLLERVGARNKARHSARRAGGSSSSVASPSK